VNGNCQQCATSSDCPGTEGCSAGTCAPCGGNNQCATGQCNYGAHECCADFTNPCVNNNDCANNCPQGSSGYFGVTLYCYSGTCRSGYGEYCEQNAWCGTGYCGNIVNGIGMCEN
jgi:hypothetical protein